MDNSQYLDGTEVEPKRLTSDEYDGLVKSLMRVDNALRSHLAAIDAADENVNLTWRAEQEALIAAIGHAMRHSLRLYLSDRLLPQ